MSETATKPESITIVVVNFNGIRFLPGCIESIINQSIKLDEIIVIDNNSTDGSVDLLKERYPSVKIFVMERNLGLTDAYNFGINASRNDWVILSNNDVVLEGNCVEVLRDSIYNPRMIATPSFVTPDPQHSRPTCPVRFFPSIEHPWSSLKMKYKFSGIYQTDMAAFGFFMMNRKAVGRIDSRFPIYFDEDDFSLECRRAGCEIVLVVNSRVIHYGSGTIGGFSLKKMRLFMNGWIAYRVKWFSPWALLPSTVFALILQFYQHVFLAINREALIAPYARISSQDVKMKSANLRSKGTKRNPNSYRFALKTIDEPVETF